MLNKHRSTHQTNNPINSSSIRNPHSSLIPGTLSSAPTSPSPNIPHVVIGTTPTSPQPNIQQQQGLWNFHAQSHSHPSQPQQNVPAVQPFTQPQQNPLGSPTFIESSLQYGVNQL
jgi:hypothetical protein